MRFTHCPLGHGMHALWMCVTISRMAGALLLIVSMHRGGAKAMLTLKHRLAWAANDKMPSRR